jgi:hypothetical protein
LPAPVLIDRALLAERILSTKFGPHPRNGWLCLHFSRNESPNFTEYLSERPEMTPQKVEAKEGQNKKRKSKERRKINTYEDKIS